MLVNGFYTYAVGHVVEALHHALGHHLADPSRKVSVLVNASSAPELADLCPFLDQVYAIEHPLLDAAADTSVSDRALIGVPREWDWIVDDHRRTEQWQFDIFPGLRDYYAATDRHFRAHRKRAVVGDRDVGYVPHARLHLEVPRTSRWAAIQRLAAAGHEQGPVIVVVPGGSSERSRYPSSTSMHLILDALTDEIPQARIVLVGKTSHDRRTRTTLEAGEVEGLLAHRGSPINGFDLPFLEQLALIESSDVFVSPHTGLGMAALAVGTPWLAISGGPWFEWFFNHVPFRSIIPDVKRYPAFAAGMEAALREDDGPRVPSMTRSRIVDDLDRIVDGAKELVSGSVTYHRAMREYASALVAAHDGDPTPIFSNDNVLDEYLWP